MDKQFDELSKSLLEGVSRRQARRRFRICAAAFGLLLACLARPGAAQSNQSYRMLYPFSPNGSDARRPFAGLIQAADGNFYGTTSQGGVPNNGGFSFGAVFKITPSGTESVLYSFAGYPSDGVAPVGGLIQATDGNLYGTTLYGGANNTGTIFKITPGGTETVLHSFGVSPGPDGASPYAGLIQAADGNLYGTTEAGGLGGSGTVFKITLAGVETVLYSFEGGYDGSFPVAGLIQATDGNFYGTTQGGGAPNFQGNSCGTVFKITPSGTESVLYSFAGFLDGSGPVSGLIQATDGSLYGTTGGGGVYDCGTIFNVTLAGIETVHYAFAGADGQYPSASLVQASDGSFYGTTYSGGGSGDGTVFRMTPSGTLTVLHSFTGWTDGDQPFSPVIQATDGKLYGTTSGAIGDSANGTVFVVSIDNSAGTTTTTLSLLPSTGQIGRMVTLAARLKNKATSASLAGKPIQFALDGVNVGTPVTTDSMGVARYSFVVSEETAPGSHPTSAAFAGDAVYATSAAAGMLPVSKGPLTISLPNVTGYLGSTVTLTAGLKNGVGTALAGKTVSFSVDGALLGTATTDSSGMTKISYQISLGAALGAHAITAAVSGDANYLAATKNATLTVTKIPVKLTANSVSGHAGTTVNLTAKLLDALNAPMTGATFSFTVSGVAAGTATTNGSGIASRAYAIPAGTASGPYPIIVAFNGDAAHLSASRPATLTVK